MAKSAGKGQRRKVVDAIVPTILEKGKEFPGFETGRCNGAIVFPLVRADEAAVSRIARVGTTT
jgi:hypothetical protein